MIFYVGLHHPADSRHFERCMVSINAIRERKSDLPVNEWILDSGAFTEVSRHGHFRSSVAEYAEQVKRWSRCGTLKAAVSQDFMCEPWILEKWGLTVEGNQQATIDRYDELSALVGKAAYVMPILQGYWADEYLRHIRLYGDRLWARRWVGVGSVCKRNANMKAIEIVLGTIHRERPDLLLHGFGVKTTALKSSVVQECLYSADSMAWSSGSRWQQDGGTNDAVEFVKKIEGQKIRRRQFQPRMF